MIYACLQAALEEQEELVDEYSQLSRQHQQDLDDVTTNWTSKKGGFAALALDDDDDDDEDNDDNDDTSDIAEPVSGEDAEASLAASLASQPDDADIDDNAEDEHDNDDDDGNVDAADGAGSGPAVETPVAAQAAPAAVAVAPAAPVDPAVQQAHAKNFFVVDDPEDLVLGAEEDNEHIWRVLEEHQGQVRGCLLEEGRTLLTGLGVAAV